MNKKLLCLLISSFLLSGCANFKKINANELAAEKTHKKRLNTRKKFVITRLSRTQQNNGLIQRQLLKSR